MDAAARHQCVIYDGAPSRMLPALVLSVRQHLDARMRCMYLNTPAMVAGVRSQLYAAGTDVAREEARGSLQLVGDNSHLVDGHFDVDRMIEMLDGAVASAVADGYSGLFATGDMTWEFGHERNLSKLLAYELRLEHLFQQQPALSGICQYHRDLLPRQAVREGLVSHPTVFINATLSQLNPYYVRASSAAERKAAARPELDGALDMMLAPNP